MTKQEEKQQLRKIMRKLEQQLPPRYRQAADRSIAAHLLAMPEYQAAGAVFCFVGTPTEIDTRPILTDALARGKTLCVPACVDRTTMVLRRIFRLEELSPGAYGILEPPAASPLIPPEDIGLLIVPCVTCSPGGERLGHGGGYYDRYLEYYQGPAILVCPDRLLQPRVPVDLHDRRVRIVATETQIWRTGAAL